MQILWYIYIHIHTYLNLGPFVVRNNLQWELMKVLPMLTPLGVTLITESDKYSPSRCLPQRGLFVKYCN